MGDASDPVLVFSDIDGTLVHYGEQAERGLVKFGHQDGAELYKEQGLIDCETLIQVASLREFGVRFVLITGARTATLFQRLPFLPVAAAYVAENGGRIFYPSSEQLTAAPLEEDHAWRRGHAAAGPPGQEALAAEEREGQLWDFLRSLTAAGWRPDTVNYSTAFRLKVQRGDSAVAKTSGNLEDVMRRLPEGLAGSFNLGHADVFPATSGKHNAARHLMQRFGGESAQTMLLCDDDNDLGLAGIVGRVFLPSQTSETILAAMRAEPGKFMTSAKEGVLATEDMLNQVKLHCSALYFKYG